MVDRLVSVDSVDNRLPDVVRQRLADDMADPATVEGASLSATIAKGTVSDNQNLAAFGDSLTEPHLWIDEVVSRQGVAVFNGGKSGQSSSEVAMRQGGLVPKVTVIGGSIPASGPVAVTVDYPTGAFKSNVAGAQVNPQYVGTIAGVAGTLVADIQGTPRTWSFTRTDPGSIVAVSGQRYFLSTEGLLQARKEQIFWTGRNFSGDRVITDTADMVAYLRRYVIDPSFTVVSIINSSAEILGTTEYEALRARNATLKATYGVHYCEVRRPLIDSALAWAGITATSGDLADIANDTVPRSLQVGDGFHLNAIGQQFVGKLIAEHRTRLGYDRTSEIVAASTNPDPTYVPPIAPLHPITIAGVTHRYVAKALPVSMVGTEITTLDSAGEPGEPKFLRPVVAGSGATLRAASGTQYLEFDGVDDRMYVPAFTIAQPYTVVVAYRLNTTGSAKAIVSLANGTPSSPLISREADGDISAWAGVGPNRLDITGGNTNWHFAAVSFNGASSFVSQDGVSSTPATVGATAIGGLRLGQGTADYSQIDIAELVIFNRALTTAEIAQVRADVKAGQPVLP